MSTLHRLGNFAPDSNKGISPVGVFVNESPEAIADLVRSGIIDVVQLHGSEDEDFLRKLRELASCPIIKAFSVKTPQDVPDCLRKLR